MSHSCEIFADKVLDVLTGHEATGPVENKKPILPSLCLSWDAKGGDVSLNHHCGPDNLIRLEGRVAGRPRWLTLQLDLGEDKFEPGDVLGLAAEIACDAEHAFEPFIRSITDKGNVDTRFEERLLLSPERPVATALHTVKARDHTLSSNWPHKLIIRLPKRDFQLDIRAMKFFVLLQDPGRTPRAEHTAGTAV